MKNLKIKTIAVLFCCVFTPFGKIMAQIINGSDYIHPGVATSYNCSFLPTNATFVGWSSNCSGVAFSTATNVTTAVTIPKTTSCCSFILSATYSTTSGTSQLNKTIKVMPFLLAKYNSVTSNVVYPGEIATLIVTSANNGGCPMPNCPPLTSQVTWYAPSFGTYTNTPTMWSQQLYCPSNNINTNQITINNVDFDNCGYDGSVMNSYIASLVLPIKLRNPTLSGPASIGCSGSPPSSVTYSVTQVTGANYYVWTYSTTQFSAIGAVNGSSITLDAIGLGAGSVSVQAFYSQGSSISSAVVSQNVQVCCIGTMAFSDVVNSGNSPYTKQAATQINTTNTITGTGSATIHAGNEVRLMAGFEAHLGSEVHIYNEGCSGVFSRMAYSDDDETADESEEIIYQYENANMESSFVTEEVVPREKFTIAPNPTNGDVTVNVFDKNSPLLFITVYNTLGSKVYEMQTTDNGTHYVFSLADLINGVYAVKLTFADYTANRLLIKQND
ncbi:MAG: T9SS type A sorting domain-containing protein [Bacteroidetes bacterium]|nr:T9SS type A sorting domain-containing protein [Bacteroidota bacterium]